MESDYIGLWNERPQGTVDYIKQLRAALDARGFGGVGITVEATWQGMIDNGAPGETRTSSPAAMRRSLTAVPAAGSADRPAAEPIGRRGHQALPVQRDVCAGAAGA